MNSAQEKKHKQNGVFRAEKYMDDVLSGVIPACELVKLAIKRQINDCEKENFNWHFDVQKANRAIRFIESHKHFKGANFAGKNIELSGWQCFIVAVIFGWVDDDDNRRFKTAYVEVPRKNGKSTLISPIGNYLAFADNEPGAEVYAAATIREQAKIVWEGAKTMLANSPELREALEVKISLRSLDQPSTSSFFRTIARETKGNHDGFNLHGGLIDELHAHKTRDLWDVLDTATGSRTQPLIFAITTAGSNQSGICYLQNKYVRKILMGEAEDERYFGIIYTLDKDDDPFDESKWIKANPNLNVSVGIEDLRAKAIKARQMASELNNFLTKHFNIWVNASVSWMNMSSWNLCGDVNLRESDFANEDCYIACDLATRIDVVAKVKLFWRDIEGVTHYYFFPQFFLNQTAIDEGRNASYAGWARDGFVEVNEGNATELKKLEDAVKLDAQKHHVLDVLVDPYQGAGTMQRLADEGLSVKEYRQVKATMSQPMKEVEALVLSGRLHHNSNPVMGWMISNVVCYEDSKENIYPNKERREAKIDGPVALIMAIGRALNDENESKAMSDYINSLKN